LISPAQCRRPENQTKPQGDSPREKTLMKKAFALLIAAALAVPAVFAQNDSDIQASVQKALNGSRFKSIQASVQGGVVTLTGNVDVVAAKVNADQKAHHVKGVTA